MDRFLKIPNFKTCCLAFDKWMIDNFNINIETISDIDRDKQLFEVMKQVKDEYINDNGIDIKTLNNISLNKLQDIYLEHLNMKNKPATNKPNTSQLQRDASLYGQRQNNALSIPMPTNTTNKDFVDVNKQFDLLMAARRPDEPPPPQELPQKSFKESAIPEDAFEKMVSLARDEYMKTNIELQLPLIPDNPQSLHTTPMDYRREDTTQIFAPMDNHEPVIQRPQNANIQQYVPQQQPDQTNRITSYKYITINGFDRDWRNQTGRYNFGINVDDFSCKYKNINLIKFTQLIVPCEIFEYRSLINQPVQKYGNGKHELAYPYLLLKIDEISDVCDGLNKNVQQSFCKFVYVKSFRCPNGRGYVNLEPTQNESKLCEQQNISSLQKLTFSLMKPNGTLYSNALDDYCVSKCDYQCYNSMYLQIVLNKFFDKNEFFIGDTILISGFSIYRPASATNDLHDYDFKNMENFINRPEGHDVVQLGDANTNGYYKSFYILAPGTLNQNIGKLTINKSWVDALKEYNLLVPPPGLATANGKLLNMSLQVVISMTIGTNVGSVTNNIPV